MMLFITFLDSHKGRPGQLAYEQFTKGVKIDIDVLRRQGGGFHYQPKSECGCTKAIKNICMMEANTLDFEFCGKKGEY